jgi:Ran GTPase-activating protein (RanGAP) involved in mRNA processing and transport
MSKVFDSLLAKISNNDPLLTSIQLNRGMFQAGMIQNLAKAMETNTNLQSIDLSGVPLTDIDIRTIIHILKTHSLSSIDLSQTNLTDTSATAIAEALKVNTSLKTINLASNQIGAAGGQKIIEAVKVNTSLQMVNLSKNTRLRAGGDAIGEALANNTSITHLNLSSCFITPAAVINIARALRSNKTLGSLNLSHNNMNKDAQVGEHLGAALRVNSSLFSLDLGGVNLGEIGGLALCKALKVNHTLTSLNLEVNELDTSCGQAISEALAGNTTLKALNLNRNKLKADGGKAIAEALKTECTLEELYLDSNELRLDGGLAICNALENNSTLKILTLRNNVLTSKTATAFGKVLKKNATLTSLDLSLNEIATGISIANALKINKTLESLNLESNKLGDEAGLAFGAALAENSTLRYLNFSSNKLKNKTATSIGRALKTNTMLTKLDLGKNELSILEPIMEALKTNSTLGCINLCQNPIQADHSRMVGEALKANKTLHEINIVGLPFDDIAASTMVSALTTNYSLLRFYGRRSVSESISKNLDRNKAIALLSKQINVFKNQIEKRAYLHISHDMPQIQTTKRQAPYAKTELDETILDDVEQLAPYLAGAEPSASTDRLLEYHGLFISLLQLSNLDVDAWSAHSEEGLDIDHAKKTWATTIEPIYASLLQEFTDPILQETANIVLFELLFDPYIKYLIHALDTESLNHQMALLSKKIHKDKPLDDTHFLSESYRLLAAHGFMASFDVAGADEQAVAHLLQDFHHPLLQMVANITLGQLLSGQLNETFKETGKQKEIARCQLILHCLNHQLDPCLNYFAYIALYELLTVNIEKGKRPYNLNDLTKNTILLGYQHLLDIIEMSLLPVEQSHVKKNPYEIRLLDTILKTTGIHPEIILFLQHSPIFNMQFKKLYPHQNSWVCVEHCLMVKELGEEDKLLMPVADQASPITPALALEAIRSIRQITANPDTISSALTVIKQSVEKSIPITAVAMEGMEETPPELETQALHSQGLFAKPYARRHSEALDSPSDTEQTIDAGTADPKKSKAELQFS